ncbi:MAG: lipid IV(A) 3-deoxy-D-manno-octulosonic acid transferase [Pseudomonadota bacterium]
MVELVRRLYTFAWWLALPLVLARLWWRGRREPGYRQHIGERLGFYRPRDVDKKSEHDPLYTLWVHAVSVGETRAAEPLIEALLASCPRHDIVLTHMTPTGRATGAALYARHGNRLKQCYLPYDIGSVMARFLNHYRPQACLLMETEVWPNLVAQCRRQGVPVALVNARLSARSLARGQKMRRLIGAAARGLTCVAAQTDADATRLKQLGVASVTVTGSMKFDIEPPALQLGQGAQWRRQFGQRKVVLFASTREGEEAAILAALRTIPIDALLVIVPRHPQRFDDVAALVAQEKLPLVRRSQIGDDMVPSTVKVLLGDSMGEMFAYYAAADLAFIGGSLLPFGGQNLIEACAVGTPVLIGPHTFNFAEVTENAVAAGAALRVKDATSLLVSIQALLGDEAVRSVMISAARGFASQHRGATGRTMALLRATMLADSAN